MNVFDITAASLNDGAGLAAKRPKPGGLSIAIGFFDGVHLGHADVVRRAVAVGRARGQTPAVMTFDPHPRVVLGHGDRYRTVLTPLADKLDRFAELGVEVAYVIRFDRDFAAVTAERFVEALLLPLGAATAVIGFDFTFGYRGEGNAESLRRFGGGAIDVVVAEPVEGGGAKVSSTRIRDELAAGDCGAVAALLGRPFSIKGIVVHGDARGRTIGFPTANIKTDQPYVIPRKGVYAVTAIVHGDDAAARKEIYRAVLNVGFRPTFDSPGGELKLEAHLFDFSGDLYGRTMELVFHAYLRDEVKFDSVEALIAQIRRDAEEARRVLAAALD